MLSVKVVFWIFKIYCVNPSVNLENAKNRLKNGKNHVFWKNNDMYIARESPQRHISTNPGRWKCKIRTPIDPPQNHDFGDRWSQNFDSDVKIPLFLKYWLHRSIFSKFLWKSKVWSLGGLQTRGFVKILPRHRFQRKARIFFRFSSRLNKLGVAIQCCVNHQHWSLCFLKFEFGQLGVKIGST